ncbi:hypothetical protein [uncultured Aquabacterium sp.]|jgi:hypothetical protein|uniref:hypothetical protein n=1 Tax=uncultured Aquabacterium sp. TaxID=158753 RepID=UPI0026277EA6|nr:hypothetical protein [uncultured Aquabacterium sp.]
MSALHYLTFEISEDTDGIGTAEGMASTDAAAHAQALAEAQTVLVWAQAHSPLGHGPLEEGFEWDHDLQISREGDWHTVTLTLSGTMAFLDAFRERFAASLE